MSTNAVIIPRFTGSISAASSALIIFIIFQSRSKLSTIYHRIMFWMSCADIIGSIAMGLTTLPMPPDTDFVYFHYTSTSYFYLPGTRLGNMQTCAAQGFIFLLGSYAMFTYNLSLCTYNTCFIGFRMQERTIIRYVEPFLHLLPLAVGLIVALPPLVGQGYEPTDLVMWCSVHHYTMPTYYYGILVPLLSMIYFAIILLCGIVMIGRVYYIERQISRTRRSANRTRVAESLKNTKVLIFQVSAYVLSYVFTLSGTMLTSNLPSMRNIKTLLVISQSLLPLQGLFNALIFIYHKIYNYRRVHDDVSRCYVFKLLLAGDSEEVMLFSRISMINHDQRRRVMEVELGDESGSVERISLEEDKPPSDAEVFFDEDDIEQNLSGFSQSPLSPVTKSSAPELEAADTSILASTSPSNKNEHAGSLNGDSRLSMSKGSGGILSWMSRGASSGISFASENGKDNAL